MDDNYIDSQLMKFQPYEMTIADLRERFTVLKINGIEDKEGYKKVRAARIVMKGHRVEVEKRRKDFTAGALKYQRAINAEASRITTLLEPIENYLSDQEQAHEKELERIKHEKEQVEAAILQTRTAKLLSLGFRFNGTHYACDYMDAAITVLALKVMDEQVYKIEIVNLEAAYNKYAAEKLAAEQAHREKLAQESAERKAEAERLQKQRLEQEAERQRLEQISREQARKESELRAKEQFIEEKGNILKAEPLIIKSKDEITPNKQKDDLRNYLIKVETVIDVQKITNINSGHGLTDDELMKTLNLLNEKIHAAINSIVDLTICQCVERVRRERE